MIPGAPLLIRASRRVLCAPSSRHQSVEKIGPQLNCAWRLCINALPGSVAVAAPLDSPHPTGDYKAFVIHLCDCARRDWFDLLAVAVLCIPLAKLGVSLTQPRAVFLLRFETEALFERPRTRHSDEVGMTGWWSVSCCCCCFCFFRWSVDDIFPHIPTCGRAEEEPAGYFFFWQR